MFLIEEVVRWTELSFSLVVPFADLLDSGRTDKEVDHIMDSERKNRINILWAFHVIKN